MLILRRWYRVIMLVPICLMVYVYHAFNSEMQEIIVKFDTRFRRICYIIYNISKILCQLGKNEGIFVLM